MPDMLGYDTENPLLYVAASVVIWVAIWTVASVIRGGDLIEAVLPGLVGGVVFGIASFYLQRVMED